MCLNKNVEEKGMGDALGGILPLTLRAQRGHCALTSLHLCTPPLFTFVQIFTLILEENPVCRRTVGCHSLASTHYSLQGRFQKSGWGGGQSNLDLPHI